MMARSAADISNSYTEAPTDPYIRYCLDKSFKGHMRVVVCDSYGERLYMKENVVECELVWKGYVSR